MSIDFTARSLEFMVVYSQKPAVKLVQEWAAAFAPSATIDIEGFRIIGTCAICGQRAVVIPCSECDRDACALDLRETLCVGCSRAQ